MTLHPCANHGSTLLFALKQPKNSKPTGLTQCSLSLTHKQKRLSNQQVQILPRCSLPNAQMPHLVRGSEREEKEMKKGDADWLRGVSFPLHCLVNQLTCSQRSLCERTLAVGQSDPRACLSPGGKWCPWYAASSRMHRQTGRLPAGPLSFFLSFFLSPSLSKMPNLTSLRGKLPDWPSARGPACPSTTYLFNSVPLPLPLHALTPTVCQLQHTHNTE